MIKQSKRLEINWKCQNQSVFKSFSTIVEHFYENEYVFIFFIDYELGFVLLILSQRIKIQLQIWIEKKLN